MSMSMTASIPVDMASSPQSLPKSWKDVAKSKPVVMPTPAKPTIRPSRPAPIRKTPLAVGLSAVKKTQQQRGTVTSNHRNNERRGRSESHLLNRPKKEDSLRHATKRGGRNNTTTTRTTPSFNSEHGVRVKTKSFHNGDGEESDDTRCPNTNSNKSPHEAHQPSPPQKTHKLHTSWSLYFHSPASSDWTMDSYTKVSTVDSVESFCSLLQLMEHSIVHLHLGMFFLMRGDIMPTWEDPQNRKGGCWSYKIPMHDVSELWGQLAMRLVGERLSTTPMLLNGISISPKRGFCIVKIWNHTSTENHASALQVKDFPKLLGGGDALYTAFSEKK